MRCIRENAPPSDTGSFTVRRTITISRVQVKVSWRCDTCMLLSKTVSIYLSPLRFYTSAQTSHNMVNSQAIPPLPGGKQTPCSSGTIPPPSPICLFLHLISPTPVTLLMKSNLRGTFATITTRTSKTVFTIEAPYLSRSHRKNVLDSTGAPSSPSAKEDLILGLPITTSSPRRTSATSSSCIASGLDAAQLERLLSSPMQLVDRKRCWKSTEWRLWRRRQAVW